MITCSGPADPPARHVRRASPEAARVPRPLFRGMHAIQSTRAVIDGALYQIHKNLTAYPSDRLTLSSLAQAPRPLVWAMDILTLLTHIDY